MQRRIDIVRSDGVLSRTEPELTALTESETNSRTRPVGNVWAERLFSLAIVALATAACTDFADSAPLSRTHQALVNPAESIIPCEARASAIIANTGMVIVNSASIVDSYDSSEGAYGGTNVAANGTVRSAGAILQNGGTIAGQKITNSPAGLVVVPVGAGAQNLPLGASSPGHLNINGSADSITLSPGNYVVQNLNLNNPGAINVNPQGPVRIWVTGNLNLGGRVNEGGAPGNVTFLVTSSGWVNVNSGGPLYGSIYAPTSSVNLSSAVFGSVIGSSVTVNSGGAVHLDESSVCAATSTTRPPRKLPAPPRERGCYSGTIDGWVAVPCTPADTSRQSPFRVPAPDPAIESVRLGVPPLVPFEFGQVEATFVAFGGLTDMHAAGSLPNTLSLQLNTNTWTADQGNEAIVQLVIQSMEDPAIGSATRICVWNIDVDEALTGNLDAYVPECVGGGDEFNIAKPPGPYHQFDFATVAGSTYTDGAGMPVIGLVAQMSWWDPADDPNNNRGLYAVVAPDTFGLGGRWSQTSGTFYGVGGESQAVFTDTAVLTRILSGSCVNATGPTPEIPWPGTCPQSSGQADTQLTETSGVVTAETSNLLRVGEPTELASISEDFVFTQYLATTSGSCISGADRVYVKDTPQDSGVVPSNLGGQPFWDSPDIFIVPEGAEVDVEAAATSTVITPGEAYEIYVRANNDFSCGDATGVRARVYLADPAALSVTWEPVTDDEFRGGPGNPDGHTVPAGGRGLVGPFSWVAPSMVDSPHKCLIAALEAEGQVAPANTFDAPNSFQVAQRNVQLFDCTYPLTNASNLPGAVELTLTVAEGVEPSLTGPNVVEVRFIEPTGVWFNVWLGDSGTSYVVSEEDGVTTVRLGQRRVTLPLVGLEPGQSATAMGFITLDFGEPTTTLELAATLLGPGDVELVSNGGSCIVAAPIEPQ